MNYPSNSYPSHGGGSTPTVGPPPLTPISLPPNTNGYNNSTNNPVPFQSPHAVSTPYTPTGGGTSTPGGYTAPTTGSIVRPNRSRGGVVIGANKPAEFTLKEDGFLTTAGNKERGSKYGNTINSNPLTIASVTASLKTTTSTGSIHGSNGYPNFGPTSSNGSSSSSSTNSMYSMMTTPGTPTGNTNNSNNTNVMYGSMNINTTYPTNKNTSGSVPPPSSPYVQQVQQQPAPQQQQSVPSTTNNNGWDYTTNTTNNSSYNNNNNTNYGNGYPSVQPSLSASSSQNGYSNPALYSTTGYLPGMNGSSNNSSNNGNMNQNNQYGAPVAYM
jgi:hypothetical protein